MTLQRCVETVDKIMATGDATIDICNKNDYKWS